MTTTVPPSGTASSDAEGHDARARGDAAAADAPRRRLRSNVVVPLAVALWFFVLGSVWAISSPTPAAIDEPTHYIKALATAQGQLIGVHAPAPNDLHDLPLTKIVEDQASRAFMVPAALAPDGVYSCNAGSLEKPATCSAGTRCQRYLAQCTGDRLGHTGLVREVSYDGEYEPTLYLLPGLLADMANNDVNGMRAARMGGVITGTVFIGLAAALLWERRRSAYALLGLLLAVTPMVAHLSASVNPSGGEIVLAICWFAGLLRLVREPAPGARWVWLAVGVSGGLLGFSRALGFVWVIAGLLFAALLLGVPATWRRIRARGGYAWAAVALVVAGVVMDQVWWKVVVGPIHYPRPLSDARHYLLNQFNGLPTWFSEQVGVFGWGDVHMNAIQYVIWSVMAVALVTVALLVGTRRQRAVLSAMVVADVIGTVLLAAYTRIAFGYPSGGMEGRYVLPFTVMVVLLAGEVIRERSHVLGDLAPRRMLLYLAAGGIFVQLSALWLNARRYAVGIDGPLMFLGHSLWAPPFGWAPWIVLGLLDAALLVAVVLFAARGGVGPENPRSATLAPGDWTGGPPR